MGVPKQMPEIGTGPNSQMGGAFQRRPGITTQRDIHHD
jgi:hypothetical protein